MRSVLNFLLVFSSLTLLSACETETPGGRVPAEYLSYAKSLTGTYKGGFDGRNDSAIVISLDGERVVARVKGKKDLLGSGCNTKIGRLLSVEGSKQGLRSAVFAMDSECAETDKLRLNVDASAKTLSASVVTDSTTTKSCPSLEEIFDCKDKLGDKASNKHDGTDSMGFSCDPSEPFSNFNCTPKPSPCSKCNEKTSYTYAYGHFRR